MVSNPLINFDTNFGYAAKVEEEKNIRTCQQILFYFLIEWALIMDFEKKEKTTPKKGKKKKEQPKKASETKKEAPQPKAEPGEKPDQPKKPHRRRPPFRHRKPKPNGDNNA